MYLKLESRLSRDSSCHNHLFEFHCMFQEHDSQKMIGIRHMIDVCCFEKEDYKNRIAQGISGINSIPIKDKLMLWYHRLGHPFFFILNMLFSGLDCSKFIVQKALRSHKTICTSRPYQASIPFYLIYSVVWGPSRINTFLGKNGF